MKKVYCDKCKITYHTTDKFLDCETDGDDYCPLCEKKETISRLRDKCIEYKTKLKRHEICEECQRNFGYCDRDKSTCDKLK